MAHGQLQTQGKDQWINQQGGQFYSAHIAVSAENRTFSFSFTFQGADQKAASTT
jgi:carotenoid cleavage dioxygenase-like enzyme